MAKKKKAKEDREEEREERDEKDLRKPVARDGAYVMMLFITLVAMVAGTVFLYLDYDEYGKQPPPKEAVPTLPKLGDDTKAPGQARLDQPPLARPAVTVAGRPLIRPGEPAALLPVAVHTPPAEAPDAR